MAMRWEDERYVRVYTRDTVEWEMLCWQARALMPLILRKVDRAGLLELGKHGARGLAASINAPVDFVTAGLDGDDGQLGLIESGAIEITGEMLIVPNFIAAQETPSSDAQRKRDQREKAAAIARAESQIVTQSHAESRDVTGGHSVPSVPSLPSRTENTHTAAAPLELISVSPSEPFDFEAIYALYPRKGDGKAKGIERLKSQIKNRETFEQALLAARHYAEKADIEQTPPNYVKRFDTWCNQHWRDYVDGPHIVERKPSPTGAPGRRDADPPRRRLQDADEYAAKLRAKYEAGE